MAIPIDTLVQTQRKMSTALVQSVNTGQTDIAKKIDPTKKNSYIKGLVDSLSFGMNDNNRNLQKVEDGLVELFLEKITLGLTKNDAELASGNVTFTGTVGGTIPVGTTLNNIDGLEYTTQAEGIIATQNISIISINRVGDTATVETATEHNLTNSVLASITGAGQTEYNIINQTISITSPTTFTFEVSGSPLTPATGTLLLNYNGVTVGIISSEVGSDKNLNNDSILGLTSPIINVDDEVYAIFDGITGGLDEESDDDFINRKLEYFNNPSTGFNVGGIKTFLKDAQLSGISGITRVYVKETTPSAGFVTIYFLRDGDTDNIPTSQQVIDTKNALIDPDTGIKPAELTSSNVIVLAPTPRVINFQFTELTPNTAIMQEAITNNLKAFFRNDADFETNISRSNYEIPISTSTDIQSNTVQSFKLAFPTTNIQINNGEMPVLGTITFP